MTDITLTPITSGYNLSKINANFDKVEDVINNDVVHNTGGNNTMYQDLDMNGNDLLNINIDPSNPGSLLTRAAADALYYNVDGDSLEGPFDAAGNVMTGLRAPQAPTEAVRKQEFDVEVNARAAGDASLQDQLNGTNPPMGSAFSEISWHGQVITNSIVIPNFKNAWSFGPTMTIAPGQFVTIPSNSFWTIANGATTGNGTLNPEIPNPLDMGVLP
ncbi:MAG: hypothetical protein [Bacteriophage sp.]|nr:MAG: hypothetical protein [Bacteriophage sp.]